MHPCRYRRSQFVVWFAEDQRTIDPLALLRGEAGSLRDQRICALSALTGSPCIVSTDELMLFHEIPADEWVEETHLLNAIPQAKPAAIRKLCDAGLLLTDQARDMSRSYLDRENRLLAEEWHLLPALYHFLTRWRDVDLGAGAAETTDDLRNAILVDRTDVEAFLERHGQPPAHFHEHASAAGEAYLPPPQLSGPLLQLLQSRRTVRSFDRDKALSLDDFSTLLYAVFGCIGITEIVPGLAALKKTSPSGGGLHSLEAYPLVLNVDGVEPGLYHYSVSSHALVRIRSLDRDAAEALADRFAAGQGFPTYGGVLFVVTSRFYRSFWKYRRHPRAYAVLLMEVGHLSQTFYLVATQRGLGPFVTAAINGAEIEKELGIDPYQEGALAILGCGVPLAGKTGLEPEFERYTPWADRH